MEAAKRKRKPENQEVRRGRGPLCEKIIKTYGVKMSMPKAWYLGQQASKLMQYYRKSFEHLDEMEFYREMAKIEPEEIRATFDKMGIGIEAELKRIEERSQACLREELKTRI